MAEARSYDVVLTIAGRQHRGWKGVRIERSLDALTGAFELSLIEQEQTGGPKYPIRATDESTLSIDGQTLITGRIDKVAHGVSARDHGISATGRDRAADLVDCAAVVSPGSWRQTSMEAIVAELLKPFGVSAKFQTSSGKPIRRFAIQPGETVQAAIERLCRFRALTAWSEPDGSVVIGNPADGRPVGRLTEGVNITEMQVSYDMADRYSDYIVKGQASGDDETNGRAVAQLKAVSKDPAITRYRPLIVIAEDQGDLTSLQKRADWEANVRAARSQTVTMSQPGWHDPSGAIWSPRARVQIVSERLGIDLPMLLVAVTLTRDQGGTRSDLSFQRPEAWQQLAVPEEADASSLKRKKA